MPWLKYPSLSSLSSGYMFSFWPSYKLGALGYTWGISQSSEHGSKQCIPSVCYQFQDTMLDFLINLSIILLASLAVLGCLPWRAGDRHNVV
jgi:hypothetical protein